MNFYISLKPHTHHTNYSTTKKLNQSNPTHTTSTPTNSRDGRPGTQTVDERFRLDFTTFLTSSEGVMVATFDGRGSSGRGVRNLHEIYKHLGTLDLEDLLHGIELVMSWRNDEDDLVDCLRILSLVNLRTSFPIGCWKVIFL